MGRERQDGVLILACGALAREITTLIDQEGLRHVTLRCLPAEWHNRPERIAPAVASAIAAGRREHAQLFVAYAECGTQGALDAVLAREGVARLPGPHCYAFYTGQAAFTARAEADMRGFFLTDFLARHFESLVIRPLGLDRHPELRDSYFGHYETLVYLTQTEDAALTARARRAAARLGLAFERRFTGYGELGAALRALSAQPREG